MSGVKESCIYRPPCAEELARIRAMGAQLSVEAHDRLWEYIDWLHSEQQTWQPMALY
jgi:hypothetical protein